MAPERCFRAMGVDVVVAGADDAEAAEIWRLFDAWDRVFSRFKPESELSSVNRCGSSAVVVSSLFARAVNAALAAAESTDGLADPTLGAALEAAGYDRDFASLDDDPRPPGAAVPGRWRTVRLAGRMLWRPPGTKLDLNGVVKALAVDEALGLIGRDGFVAAGGDVAVRGSVVVGLPAGGAVRLREGGVATSSSAIRRWRRGAELQHHLIDPRTGRPAVSPWTHVTVAAESCLAADVAAKAAFLLAADGPDWLEQRSLPGRFVSAGGIVENAVWREAMHERSAAVA